MKTMDFFGQQQRAKRNTSVLVILFALAVILMIVVIYAAVIAFLAFSKRNDSWTVVWFQPGIFVIVTLATLAIVALGSLYKTLELRRGGETVAVMLGGRLVNTETDDIAERRLINVVEEMALAAGVAVPPVFLLEKEHGINAFAAGLTPDDAVIAVSQGALEHLNRDELQGVVAHEFSHILNGDMRFNLRLIGILHGILIVGLIGYYMMHLSGGSSSGSRRGKGGGQIVLLGLVIMIVGYLGLFFGRLIKAAVSRQREYLADAAAVQFTRNPAGVGGALKKIGGLLGQSFLQSPAAETASHMFFGSAIHRWAHSPLSTHPPLVDRVRAVDPNFDGKFPKIIVARRHEVPESKTPDTGPPSEKRSGLEKLFPGLGFSEKIPIEPAIVLAAVGAPTAEHVDYCSQLIAALPQMVEKSAREPFGARCVVFALLLDSNDVVRQKQLQLLVSKEGESTGREVAQLADQLTQLSKSSRLPLIDIAQGTLRRLSSEQYRRFRARVVQLIKADEKINLFEFIVMCVLLSHLDRVFGLASRPRVRYYSIRGVAKDAACLMSTLANVGHRDPDTARRIYSAAVSPLQLDSLEVEYLDRAMCTLSRLKPALENLATCAMPIKKRILGAATLCVAADGTVTVGEAELLRAVADSLDCPIPPILPGAVRKAG